MTAQEYILVVAKHLRDTHGIHPEHADIELELAVRCLDMLLRNRELESRAVAAEQRLALYEGVSRP